MNENEITSGDNGKKCGLNEKYLLEIEAAFSRLSNAPDNAGIIYSRYFDTLYKQNFSGRDKVESCPLNTFLQVLFEFDTIASGKVNLLAPKNLREIGERKIREKLVPLAMVRMPYQQFISKVFRTIAVKMQDHPESLGLENLGPEDVLQPHECFMAAPLFDHSVWGGKVTFELSNLWFVNGSNQNLHSLEIDFDDGKGFRPAPSCGKIAVEYSSTGAKSIQIRASFEDTKLEAATTFTVSAIDGVLDPSSITKFESDKAYQSYKAKGSYWIWLSQGRKSVVKPAVICDGFNPDNSLSPSEIYRRLSECGLIKALHQKGYDIVILDPEASTLPLQANAYLFETLLRKLNAIPGRVGNGIAIGISMGALIVRYALCDMLTNNVENPQISHYISLDGPHNGLVIAPGLQFLISLFADWSVEARKIDDIFKSHAIRQLLTTSCSKDSATAKETDERTLFKAQLREMGDFPLGITKLAIGNGSRNGTKQAFLPGDQLLKCTMHDKTSSGPEVAWFDIWAQVSPPGGTVASGVMKCCAGQQPWKGITEKTQALDACPGSTNSSYLNTLFEFLRDGSYKIQGRTVYAQAKMPKGSMLCMVPSVSSLAFPATWDPNTAIESSKSGSFDDFYLPTVNQPHCHLDPSAITWLIGKI